MPTRAARRRSSDANKFKNQVRDLICDQQEISDTKNGVVDCILKLLEQEVSQPNRDRVVNTLVLLKRREEVAVELNPTYPNGGFATAVAVKWINSLPLPPAPRRTPRPQPIATRPRLSLVPNPPAKPGENKEDAISTEERRLPKVNPSMSREEQLNIFIEILRRVASNNNGKIKGGVRPVLRQLAPWMNESKMQKVMKELTQLGYIAVIKKGGTNTLVKIDSDLALIPMKDAKSEPGESDDKKEKDTNDDTKPSPAEPATPDSKTSPTETQLAEMLVISESLASERDTALRQCSELQQQNTTLQGDVEDLERKLQDRTDEVADLDAARRQLIQQLRDAETKITTLTGELTTTQEQLSTSLRQLNSAREQLASQPDPATAVLERLRQLGSGTA